MEEEWMNNLLDILGKVALEVMKEYEIDYEGACHVLGLTLANKLVERATESKRE